MQQQAVNTNVDQWRQAGHFSEFQNQTVFNRHNQGPPQSDKPSLVLIHGFPTASWDWHRMWGDLEQQFELTAVDMLGFGLSGKPAQLKYTIALQSDLHEFVLQQRGISNCHLLVHDYGVSVAQELLARQLENQLRFQIKSCIFLNGGLFHGIHRPLLIQKLLASPLGFLLPPLMGKGSLQRSMRRIFSPQFQPDQWEIDQMWSLIEQADGRRAIPKVSRYMHERRVHYHRWLNALQQAKVPLRLVSGSLDPISGANLAQAYRELIPNPDVVDLTDTGHYPQLENPGAVLNACRAFWNDLPV